jgi:hypothetical protein
MTEPLRDQWAEWLLNRGTAGDKAGWVEFLRPVRDRVLENASLSECDTLLDVGAGDGMIAFGALERMEQAAKSSLLTFPKTCWIIAVPWRRRGASQRRECVERPEGDAYDQGDRERVDDPRRGRSSARRRR